MGRGTEGEEKKEREEGREGGRMVWRDGEMYREKCRRKRLPAPTNNTESCTVEGCHLRHCAAMHHTIHCIQG